MRTSAQVGRIIPLVAVAAVLIAWTTRDAQRVGASAQAGRESSADTATDAEVAAACGTCHLVPPADILPRSVWRDEIADGP